MDEKIKEQIELLNAKDKEIRLGALKQLKAWIDEGAIPKVPQKKDCNNHVHSRYSFSPYSPAKIAWKAYQTGLATCGIVDHESVAGVLEFRDACEIMGITPTIGFEVRLNWTGTPLEGKKFNNPDQLNVGYFPCHGAPIQSLDKIEEFLVPIRKAREERNRAMTKKADSVLKPYGMGLDFEKDVIPVSNFLERGEITERHLLFATGQQMIKKYGRGAALVEFLKNDMQIAISDTTLGYLSDPENEIYDYDLTNLLKGYFSEKMYIPANETETPNMKTTIGLIKSFGAIPTYTYLGDVKGESVTGDKKVQKFEDDHMDEIFACLSEYGMQAFSYAPARNSADQIEMVQRLCKKYNMLEILGEDINQPRQPFINTKMNEAEKERFDHATWAIIGHEKASREGLEKGMFAQEAIAKYPDINDRIAAFEALVH